MATSMLNGPHSYIMTQIDDSSKMATSAEEEWAQLMQRADAYHKVALWQEKLRILLDALAICEEP